MNCIEKKIPVVLSGLACLCLLLASFCSKNAPVALNGNGQNSAAVSNQTTVVKIISPYDNQTFLPGDSILFLASVGDSLFDSSTAWHGIVSFYRNNVLVGKDSVAPYMCTWIASTPGTYVLIAKATTGGVLVGTDTITVSVRDAFISISSPYEGQTFSPGASIQIIASPIPAAKHTVARVDFYRNGSFLGSVWRSPFSYLWKNPARGAYEIKAVAHDTRGKIDSAKVSVSVVNVPPYVYINSWIDGSVFFKGDTVKISAWAADSDGTVTRVLFYQNGKNIGSVTKPADSSGIYNFSLYDTVLGTFTLTAKAIDNIGDTGFSNSVTITRRDGFIVITAPKDGQVFETGSAITVAASAVETKYHTVKSVRFYRDGKLLSTTTKAPFQYTWQNAANGTYRFIAVAVDTKGRIDTANAATITVKNMPPIIYLSAYGAYSGSSDMLLQSDSLILVPYVVDSSGAPVASVKYYENGKLIATTHAQPFVYSFSLKNTPVGTYTFYAVASTAKGSTGTSFPITITVVSKLPQITLTSPISGAVYAQTDPITMSASLQDIDSVSCVRFVIDSQQVIAVDSTSPYSATITKLAPGFHTAYAVAVVSSGRTYASNGVYFTVNGNQEQAPYISLISPPDSSTFSSTDSILLQAAVTDSNHTVARVTFYADSATVGVDSLVPYACRWVRPPKGNHVLWADETTYSGLTKSSQVVRITVK
jgi:hypothetical protein